MLRFIELHQPDSSGPRPVIINVDRIVYITPMKEGALLHFDTVDVNGTQDRFDSRPYTLHVKEDYYTIKELLRCL